MLLHGLQDPAKIKIFVNDQEEGEYDRYANALKDKTEKNSNSTASHTFVADDLSTAVS